MSTSLLYHAWGIRDCAYKSTSFVDGNVIFNIEYKENRLRCPECDSADTIKYGVKTRYFDALPIGSRATIIALKQQRISCKRCDAVRWIEPSFAKAGKQHLNNFARYALALLKKMNIKDVVKHLGKSWTFIKNIQKEYLQKHYGRLQ